MLLNRKIVGGALLLVVLFLLAGLGSALTLRRAATTTATVRHTESVRRAIDDAWRQMIELETGMRGYLLSGNDEFIENYESARAGIPDRLAALRRLVADDPSQEARLDELEPILYERISLADSYLRVRKTQGLSAASEAASAGGGKTLMDRGRRLVEQLAAEEDRLLQERMSSDRTASIATYAVLGGAFTAGILLVITAAALLGRSIPRRTRELVDGLDRLASGDLDVRVSPGARDELGQLASAFNRTVAQRREASAALTHVTTLLGGL
ncbi:MAG TPA: CHASE3 domain-containing protein, partial [Labilithrix sp.]|nr:CHASE3 domain-containing protein [Labilithrix sp.]